MHLIAAFDLWKCTNFNSNIKRNLDDSANQLIYHPKWIYYPNLLSQMRSLKLNAGNYYFFMLLNFVIRFIALVCFGGIFASKLLHFYCNTLLTAFYSFSKDIAFCVFLYYKWYYITRRKAVLINSGSTGRRPKYNLGNNQVSYPVFQKIDATLLKRCYFLSFDGFLTAS